MLLDAGFGPGWSRSGASPHRLGCPQGGDTRRGSPWGRMLVGEGQGSGAGLGCNEATAGRDRSRGHLGCGWGQGGCCSQPSCGSTFLWERCRFGGVSLSRFGVHDPPSSAVGSLHWGSPSSSPTASSGGTCRAPPKCHRGDLSIWEQGNGTKQGLNPKRSHPPAQGAAATPKPAPATKPPCHSSGVTPGCPHTVPPSLGTGRVQQ